MKQTSSGTLKEQDLPSPPSESDRILFLLVSYIGDHYERHWYIGELTGPSSSSSFTHLCMLPIDTPISGTSIILGSCIYYIGGCFLFGRFGLFDFHSSKVYVFDTLNPNKGWNQVCSMHVPRKAPFAVAVDGKIYVFGGHRYSEVCPFGEVFDTVSGAWEVLDDPPVEDSLDDPMPSITNKYVPSIVNGLIPVHLGEQFYGLSVDDQSWVPMYYLDFDEFDLWYPAVFMDDVVYMYNPGGDCVLGYNFVKKKLTNVMFDGQFPNPTICFAQSLKRRDYNSQHYLLSLRDRNLCLISCDECSKINVKKFKICKSQYEGDIETLSAMMGCSTTFNVSEGNELEHVISLSGQKSSEIIACPNNHLGDEEFLKSFKDGKEAAVTSIIMKKEEYPNGFQVPLHFPRYSKADYEKMEEWKLDMLLYEYGLCFKGTLDDKKAFAMGTFLWSDRL